MGELDHHAGYLEDYFESFAVAPREKQRVTVEDWGIEAFTGWADPIQWLIEPIIPKQTSCLLAASGGLGKSYLCLDACVRIAAGPGITLQRALGGKVTTRGKAVMITAEDSQAAIHRRLNQIINPEEHKKLKDHFFMVPLPDAGGTQAYLECLSGQYRMTAAWDDLCSQIIKIDPELVIIDPMQAVVQADVNDPAAGQAWWSAMSQLCAEAKTASITTHHMRKDGKIDGIASARAAVRGSSSLVDGARLVMSLWPATTDDRLAAENALKEPLGPLGMVQGAVVKSNEYGHGEVATYLRDPVSGLLVDFTEDLKEALEKSNTLGEDALTETVAEANRRWEAEQPFSKAVQSERWIGAWMMKQFGCSRSVAKAHVKDWIGTGYLIQEWCKPLRNNGLKGH
tara:strand:+ start:55 stop:1248 length:1194 start_codon:yes stop_codon:yes gene_type:complete